MLAPQQSPLLGLVSVVAPWVAGGNTAVVTSKARPWLAEHADGYGIGPNGAPPAGRWRSSGWPAGTKRVVRPPVPEPDPGLTRMTPFLETKTVRHPMGV